MLESIVNAEVGEKYYYKLRPYSIGSDGSQNYMGESKANLREGDIYLEYQYEYNYTY